MTPCHCAIGCLCQFACHGVMHQRIKMLHMVAGFATRRGTDGGSACLGIQWVPEQGDVRISAQDGVPLSTAKAQLILRPATGGE